MDASLTRYAKQILVRGIGEEGQRRLARATAVVVGLGALGSVSAGQLCRAGVGHLRLVDRDVVELSNLQRQVLYTEEDARQHLPKAVAAEAALRAANADVQVQGHVADVTRRNVLELVRGADVVVDGTDNLETRLLLNDACLQLGVPWVYGGALGTSGSTMAILPGRGPCLRCIIHRAPPPGTLPTCDTEGVLASAPGVVASLQVAQALRLLLGVEPEPALLCLDVWELEFQEVAVSRREDCPACAGRYEYLERDGASWTTVLCGRNSVQITPADEARLDLEALAGRLSRSVPTEFNGFLLTVVANDRELVLFPTGRAIIQGTTDEAEARALYARFVGN